MNRANSKHRVGYCRSYVCMEGHYILPRFFHFFERRPRRLPNRTQNLPYVQKWARFENRRPKFVGFSPETWLSKTAHFLTTWRLQREYLGNATTIDKLKKTVNYEWSSTYILLKLGELWPTNGWDIIAFLTHSCTFVIAHVFTRRSSNGAQPNSTTPHFRHWARFKNGCDKLGGFIL